MTMLSACGTKSDLERSLGFLTWYVIQDLCVTMLPACGTESDLDSESLGFACDIASAVAGSQHKITLKRKLKDEKGNNSAWLSFKFLLRKLIRAMNAADLFQPR